MASQNPTLPGLAMLTDPDGEFLSVMARLESGTAGVDEAARMLRQVGRAYTTDLSILVDMINTTQSTDNSKVLELESQLRVVKKDLQALHLTKASLNLVDGFDSQLKIFMAQMEIRLEKVSREASEAKDKAARARYLVASVKHDSKVNKDNLSARVAKLEAHMEKLALQSQKSTVDKSEL